MQRRHSAVARSFARPSNPAGPPSERRYKAQPGGDTRILQSIASLIPATGTNCVRHPEELVAPNGGAIGAAVPPGIREQILGEPVLHINPYSTALGKQSRGRDQS